MNAAQTSVSDAVSKLNAHEAVMPALTAASERIKEAAAKFAELRETFESSSRSNLSAAEAQEKAAGANLTVAGQFERVGERLPELRQAIEDGARIIGSLGQPLLELSALLSKTPEILEGQATRQAEGEATRTSLLLAQTESLVKAVADAAARFSEVKSLGEHLADSAERLKESGKILESFGKELSRSSQTQASAAASSEKAAAAGLRAAEALLPIPQRLEEMTDQLEAAGSTIESGAEAARDTYAEVAKFQREWFTAVEIGLGGMRNQLQHLINEFGTKAEGTTTELMQQWMRAVNESLSSFSVLVQRVEGAIEDMQTTKKSP